MKRIVRSIFEQHGAVRPDTEGLYLFWSPSPAAEPRVVWAATAAGEGWHELGIDGGIDPLPTGWFIRLDRALLAIRVAEEAVDADRAATRAISLRDYKETIE